MAVAAGYEPKSYISDGSLSPRTIEWPIASAGELIVEVDGAPRTLNLHYEVNGVFPATQIVPLAGFASNGQTVSYRRATVVRQDYNPTGAGLEKAPLVGSIDRQAMVQQEQREQLLRTVMSPVGETGFTLASTALRSGRIFAFAPDGTQDFQLTVASILTAFSNVTQLQDWREADLAQIVDLQTRAIAVPLGEVALTLPAFGDRANRLPRFNASGGFDAVVPATGPDWSVVVLDSAGAPHSVQLRDLIEQAVSGDLDGGVWGDDPANLDGGVWA